MSDRLHVEQLTPNCGSAISGLHVKEFTETEIAVVLAEVSNRCVVVLPEQFITPKEQMDFAARFGDVLVYESAQTLEGAPGVMPMESNFLMENPAYHTNEWHTDGAWLANPPAFTFLSCEQPAPLGGDTMWSNQYLAYNTLSDRFKAFVSGLQSVCVAEWASGDEAHHPVVRLHPETGRKSLYVTTERVCSRLKGLEEEESRLFRDFLYRHSQQPEHVYRHRWRKGDLVIWDNRCSMHYAVRDYDPNATRTMHRTLVAGEIPIADTV